MRNVSFTAGHGNPSAVDAHPGHHQPAVLWSETEIGRVYPVDIVQRSEHQCAVRKNRAGGFAECGRCDSVISGEIGDRPCHPVYP